MYFSISYLPTSKLPFSASLAENSDALKLQVIGRQE
jgi:hypothetical protein